MWGKKWGNCSDPQLDPHGEMRGKGHRAPGRKFSLPAGSFFLSVASYVVKLALQRFRCKEKYRKQKEIHHFQQKTVDILELLGRFELPTSSLPIIDQLIIACIFLP